MFTTRIISPASLIQSIAPRLMGPSSTYLIRSRATKEDPSALSTDSSERQMIKSRLAGLGLLPFMQDISYPAPVRAVNESLMQIQSDLVNEAQ